MGSMVSGLADAVLGVVEGVGLSADTVVKFCDQRDLDALSARVIDETGDRDNPGIGINRFPAPAAPPHRAGGSSGGPAARYAGRR